MPLNHLHLLTVYLLDTAFLLQMIKKWAMPQSQL